LKEGD